MSFNRIEESQWNYTQGGA